MLRSVLAVLAGFLVTGVVTTAMSPGLPIAFLRFSASGDAAPVTDGGELALLLAAHGAGVLLGGFTAAALGGRRPLWHALGFAVVLLLAMLAGLPEAEARPAWWLAISFALAPLAALAGGLLARPRPRRA
ncbi:MAG: hypothetical protein ISR76_04155 [Planctomycetes bacterium]|nr:hypothetical protein [Planctomycetota bacterium]MBL7008166.1 hypothetical protein [Planctomycetota bacterium]